MERPSIRLALTIAVAGLLTFLVGACGSDEDAAGDTKPVEANISQYRAYLRQNAESLISLTESMRKMIEVDEIGRAQSRYTAARFPYGRIEPVVESIGDLDRRIDADPRDVPAREFQGFHRIEKALWWEDTTDGMVPVARQLQADLEELRERLVTIELEPREMLAGTSASLGKLSAALRADKQEERYADLDLVDITSNIDAAAAVFEAVKPPLVEADPGLAREIEAKFDALFESMEPAGYGSSEYADKYPATFIQYHNVTRRGVRKLAREIDSVAESLGEISAAIAPSESAG